MQRPLDGVRVIDISRVLAGPYCAMLLGDLGADVIKVELPGHGDDTRFWGPPFAGGEAAYYLYPNRNKRGITLNLKHEAGRRLLVELVKGAHVVVENFKHGTLERWGIGYDHLREINPRLVFTSISGYGPDGPDAGRLGYDYVAQAESGIMSITGEPDGEPIRVGVAISDLTTGMMATIATLAALRVAEATGVGQRVDCSLLETSVSWLANIASSYLVAGELPRRWGNAHPTVVPYQTFRASDGWFVLAVGNDRQFADLCRTIERPELAEDERYRTNPARIANRAALIAELQTALAARPVDEWLALFRQHEIPCGAINTLDRVFSNPQVLHRQMVVEVPHPTAGTVKLVGIPFKLSGTPADIRRHPPLLGEHTDEVLMEELGLSAEEVERLRAEGVI